MRSLNVRQALLEVPSDIYRNPANLLTRNPKAPDAIWSIWEQLDPSARQQVVEIAKTFKKSA